MLTTRRGLRTTLGFAALALVAGLVPSPAAQAATEPIRAVFSNVAETPTLDPAIAFSSDGLLFVRNVYEGLLEYAPASTELLPALAASWEVSEDGLTYTFALREGVAFHDGSTLDADDVVASLERIRTVNQGPATLLAGVDTIAAVDNTTVEIVLTGPDRFFLGVLPKLAIASSESIAENGDEWFATNENGTGPYRLERWDRNQAINLVAFDDYWRPFEAGTPTEVVLRVDPDVSTAMQLLGSGAIDMMGAVGPDEALQAQSMSGVTVVEQQSYEVRMLPIVVTQPPLDDVRVREAISLAFDYEAMVDFFSGFGAIPQGPLPAGLLPEGFDARPMAQDLDRARELLAEAGYPDGGFSVTFLGLDGLSYEEFAGNVLQEQLGELGITVEQQLVPWPQMVEIQSNPDTAAGISFLNQSAFTNDPTFLLRSAYSTATHADKGGYNWSYYSNPDVDRLLDEARAAPDDASQGEILTELVETIMADFAAVYVVEPTLAQPVREGWDVTYETLDYNYVIRFFYARQT
jgi:peptide/nickel transport system substrate-binding protein